jgi:carbon storage regulator
MLVITRKNGEQLIIGGEIEVTVLKIQGNRVKLGIHGPADVPIHRKELHARILYPSQETPPAQMLLGRSSDDGEAADRHLERRLKSFLEGLSLPALRDLEVEVQNGAAVITGRVRTFYQKQLAASCCQRVAGVLNVLNEVRVTDSSGMTGTCEDGS